jgi:FkbM family methyltransferase
MQFRKVISSIWYFIRRVYYKIKFRRLIIRPDTSDFKVFEQIFLFKEYDIKIPFEPNLIIDAGANVGYASIYFAKRFPNCKIIALEPEKTNFDTLLLNCKNMPNIIPLKKGLWHENTVLYIDNINDNKWSFELTTEAKEHGIAIETCTISELEKQYGAIDILKMDIEGAEKEVFEYNSSEWPGRIKLIIVETHDHKKNNCSQTVHASIMNFDFHHFRHGENDIYINEETDKKY